MKKYLAVILAGSMLVTALAGCGTAGKVSESASVSASSSSQQASASTTNFSDTSVLNLDWMASNGTDSMFECPWADWQSLYPNMVFDSLVKIEIGKSTMVASLADKWEVSADGKTYTFTLNQNAKWHDGTAFTADDVLFSYNTILQVPESFYKTYFSSIIGAQDVIDKKAKTISGITAEGNKVTIKLSTPDNSVMRSVFAAVVILPKHLLKDVDPTLFTKNEAFWKKPIGTGAYTIDKVSFPNYFTVVRNDSYFGKKANIKNVLFTSHVTGGVESTRADVLAGKLDFAFGNAINDIVNAQNITSQNKDIKMMIVPSTYQRQFWFNNVGSTDKKYNTDMQKVEVRQAINLLLDKESLASFYKGQAVPLTTCVNPEMAGYNTSIPLFARNVAKAKEMLKAAGFDFTRAIRILYYYDDQTTKDFMEVIKQNFSEAGVSVTTTLATGDLASVIYKVKNWDICYCGASNPDPILVYNQIVPDSGIVDGLFGDVANRQKLFGTLIAQYKAATDATEMKKIGDQIQLEANKYSIVVPIYGMNTIRVYNKGKLKVDESIFSADIIGGGDLKFEKWELLK